MKRVIIAETCCLCYGAERSINKTYEALNGGLNVVLFKEILHNKNVMKDLMSKGSRVVENLMKISLARTLAKNYVQLKFYLLVQKFL